MSFNTVKKSVIVESSDRNEELEEPSMEGKNMSGNQTIYGAVEPKLLGQNTLMNRLSDIVRRVRLRQTAQRLLNSTPSRMLKNMKPHQYAFINDKSQDFSDLSKRKKKIFQLNVLSIERKIMVSYCFQLLKKIAVYIPVINPSSNLKYIWDLVISLCLLFGFILLSATISFGPLEMGALKEFIVELLLIVCAADILVTCNTGFYKRGIICNNRGSIWRKYYNEQLGSDIFSLIPLMVHLVLTYQLGESEILGFLLLPMLLRWKPIMRASNRASQKYILRPNLRNITKLISLFFKILLIAHICACIWIFTGRQSQRIGNSSWIQTKNLVGQPWPRQYLSAFYFCTVTMATVGYGDYVPISSIEIAVCIFMVLFACGVFGFSVNTIQGILADFSSRELEITQKMITIKNYLATKGIGPSLSKDVTEYLEYYIQFKDYLSPQFQHLTSILFDLFIRYFWRANQSRNQEDEEKMINQLSDSLKMELLLESNKIVLRESSIFSNNFSEEILKKIIPLIQEQRYTPCEVIFSCEDEYLDRSIFFVQEGIVEVYISTTVSGGQGMETSQGYKTLRRLNKGEAFGEVEFFTGQNRVISVRSVGFSTILKIERSKFIEIVKLFPQDYEQFMHIKDRLLFLHDYQRVQYKCSSCFAYSHLLEFCPYLHFIPNKPKTIAISNRSEPQKRDRLFSRFTVKNEIKSIENNSSDTKKLTLQINQKKRHHRQFQLVNDTIIDYIDYNIDSLDDYCQKYLSYSIGKCDFCLHQYANSPNNNINLSKDASNLGINIINNNNISLNNVQPQLQQQQQQPYYSPFNPSNNNNNFNLISPLVVSSSGQILNSPALTTPAASRANYFKRVSLARTLQDEADEDQASVSSSAGGVSRLQPLSLSRKQTSKLPNEADTIKRQQIKQNTIISNYLKNSNNLENSNIGGYNQLSQFGGLNAAIPEIESFGQLNRSEYHKNQSFQPQQNRQNTASTITNATSNNQNEIFQQQQPQQQHIKEIFFDAFCGEFEKMHHFELYFPLNNYLVVVKQLLMDDDQKRRLRQKLLQQQRANLTRMAAKQKQKIHSKVRGSFRIPQNLTTQTANGNAIGFDFIGLKRIVDGYERETKTARGITVNNLDSISMANLNNSNLNMTNLINNSNNLLPQTSIMSPNVKKVPSKSIRISPGKMVAEYNSSFFANREEQGSSKHQSSEVTTNQGQLQQQQQQQQQQRRQSAFYTQKDEKGIQGIGLCSSIEDSQNSSEFNIFQPQNTLGQQTLPGLGLGQYSEEQNNNKLNNIVLNSISTLANTNSNKNCNNIGFQSKESPKCKKRKSDRSFSPPQQEEQILNYEHNEKPDINVSNYNTSLDAMSKKKLFQFNFVLE